MNLALVTGTSAGLGAAVAAQLLDRNWHVVGGSRRTAAIRHPRYRHVTAGSRFTEARFGV